MKKTLIIGSTVVDVIIGVDKLPTTQEDTHTTSHKMNLGGCAYNVSEIFRQSKTPYLLASPVGSGAYGEFVKNKLTEKNIPIFVKTPEIDHGAEYLFSKEWFTNIDINDFDSVYICGLEVEEKTGENLVAWLEEIAYYKLQIFFAPGPRLTKIEEKLINRIFALNPIIHLNEKEAFEFSGENQIEKAAMYIFSKTQNSVVITLGEKGALSFTKNQCDIVPAFQNQLFPKVIDTIGAGDSHIGTLICSLKRGKTLKEACEIANIVSSAVVGVSGANLLDSEFNKLSLF